MFSSKAGWHLPFALLTLVMMSYVFGAAWFTGWRVDIESQGRAPHALDHIFSPSTINALYGDAKLHSAIVELTDAVAKASVGYGQTLKSGTLTQFGKSLEIEVTRVRVEREIDQSKRLFYRKREDEHTEEGFAGVISNIVGKLSGNGTTVGDLLTQATSGMTGEIVSKLATPAYFLGIGLGIGADTGFNIAPSQAANDIASKLAAAIGEQATGINLVAQNLGSGLSAQLAPTLKAMSPVDLPVGMMAFAVAQGIGEGSASGLNLTQTQYSPANNTDLVAMARNFGLGITGPIAGSTAIQKMLLQAGGRQEIIKRIPQIAAAAGHGLGQGASAGMGLTKGNPDGVVLKRDSPPDPNRMDVPGLVGNLSFGLSRSFLETSHLSALLEKTGRDSILDTASLASFAAGAGKGISNGVVLGLRENSTKNLTARAADAENDTGGQVGQEFTKSLVATLLQNGGMSAIGHSLTSSAGGLKARVDVNKVIEGAARGLIEGSVSAMAEAGGLQKVITGDFPEELAMRLKSLPESQFNDSLNGSIVAFARGLSSEGVLLISKFLNRGNESAGVPDERNITARGVVPHSHMKVRDGTLLAPAINDQTLQDIAQTGVDTMTCAGFGGLAGLALGLRDNPFVRQKMDLSASALLNKSSLAVLPQGPVTIKSAGNTFVVDLGEHEVTINGIKSKPFALLTGLHIAFTSAAFFFALPAYLALGAIWRFSDMIGRPIDPSSMKKWRMVVLLGLFLPLAVAGIVLGIVGKGSAAHFRTVHGQTGLVTLLFLFPAVVFGFLRLRSTLGTPQPSHFLFSNQLAAIKGPHQNHLIATMFCLSALGISIASWITGFSDLRSISLCIIDAILTGPILAGPLNLILFMQISALSLLIVRFLLERRIAMIDGEPTLYYQTPKKSLERSSTIRTFRSEKGRPIRTTADLIGHPDSKIGWPSSMQKLGESPPKNGFLVNSVGFLGKSPPLPNGLSTSTIRDGYQSWSDHHSSESILGESPPIQMPLLTRNATTSSLPLVHHPEQPISPSVYTATFVGFGEEERSPFFTLPRLANRYPSNVAPSAAMASSAFHPAFTAAARAHRTSKPSMDLDPQGRYVEYNPHLLQPRAWERDLANTPGATETDFEEFHRP